MPLLLFDIDGTIMLNGTVMRDVFEGTFEEVTECPPGSLDFSFAGCTDRGIFERFLQGTGREPEVDSLFERFTRRYCENVARTYPTADGPYTLPGVEDLLRELRTHDDVGLALCTGNLRETAYIKLARFELDSYFPVGGFGDHHAERWRVVDTAWSAAREHYGDGESVPWVIGDTREDVKAAHHVGARVLGVATGPTGQDELTGADVIVDDLSDTAAISEILLSS